MSGNVFDQSASMGDGSRLKNPKSSRSSSSSSKDFDPEMLNMLNKMQEMREDLEGKLEDVREAAKKNGIDIEKYFNNSYKPTKNESNEIEMQKGILSKKIEDAFPKESCIKKNPKSKELLTKERKGKFRGERQKWIPM